jgi:hypothetical protein
MVGFPLLLIPLAIYNIIVFLMPGVALGDTVVTVPLMSGASWAVTPNDVLLAFGVLMLLLEVVKGARPGSKYLTDHLLSLIIFGGAVAEFVLWPRFANSTYFLLILLALTDFLSGVALRVRRSPAGVDGSRNARQRPADVEPVTEVAAADHSAPASEAWPKHSEPAFDHSETATPPAGPQASNSPSQSSH